MKEIMLSDIPFEVADNVETFWIPRYSHLPISLIRFPGAIIDPPNVRVETYRINRRK
ncbi:MAG: hypothetical protein KAV87_03335 [Desulfobacteraceae bacterium]|nr:hypothetical protein [Desulfobacteraceae bacterium]